MNAYCERLSRKHPTWTYFEQCLLYFPWLNTGISVYAQSTLHNVMLIMHQTFECLLDNNHCINYHYTARPNRSVSISSWSTLSIYLVSSVLANYTDSISKFLFRLAERHLWRKCLQTVDILNNMDYFSIPVVMNLIKDQLKKRTSGANGMFLHVR